MKLIVGLGNVGSRYAQTRHNIGFMVVDQIARELGASWETDSKLKAMTVSSDNGSERLVLAKPTTMMNASGEAVQRLAQRYKLKPEDVWVVFDDVDTPFGRLRQRRGGGSSGHQGINSTISSIGSDFWRFKVGVSLNDRTVEPSEVYVLKPFNELEAVQLPELIAQTADHIMKLWLEFETPADATLTLLPLGS